MDPYPWFEIAKRELGVHEIPGPESKGRILEYIATTAYPDPYEQDDSAVPWCACFIQWCMEKAGIEGTNSAWARSWLDWGREPTDAEFGEGVVVVLERGGNSGHVGFLEDWDDNRVKLLGGNQGNAVSYAWFPMSRVLGYRVPA